MDLKETGWKGLASEGQVASSCEHDNEYSTYKLAKFLDLLRNYVLLKKDYVPRSRLVSQSDDWLVGQLAVRCNYCSLLIIPSTTW